MRGDLPAGLESIWRGGDYTGANRPFARVTVRRPQMRLSAFNQRSTFLRVWPSVSDADSFNPYPDGIDPTQGESITNIYADYLFHPPVQPKELPNVASISWTRSVDADVAEASIEFYNTAPLPLGEVPENGDLDQPGLYSANRGTAAFSSRWGHEPNEWRGLLLPDNLLYTYQGYGTDTELGVPIGEGAYVPPERDSKMVLTGVWMIDEVRLSHKGRIVASCRDLGRLLLDHQSFLPVVPDDFYPVSVQAWPETVTVNTENDVVTRYVATERVPVTPLGSGNDLWPESAYPGARVHGHSHVDAFDGNPASYWLSVGNARSTYRSAYEYLDFACNGATVTEVRMSMVGSGYNVYVSVMRDGSWINTGFVMPYHRDGRGRYEEGVPYVSFSGGVGEGEFRLPIGTWDRVERIRVWFGNLPSFGLPGAKYRAGCREMSAWGPVERERTERRVDTGEVDLVEGPAGSNPGFISDFTDIVKLMCAWAGLYWPQNGYERHCDGRVVANGPTTPDWPVLGGLVPGRVYGDFQATGTAPPNEIGAEVFDKKSLMDGVRYLADMLGFMFFVDETGGAQWRMSNIWVLGNWVTTGPNPGRTAQILTIDERQVLLGLDAVVQSRNVREGVFVSGGKDQNVMVGGFNPNPTGLRRVSGWTDLDLESKEEATVMADLIAVRQMFRYREDRVRIPAHPGIQIDDQVRIFERVASEGFVHYVKGIASSFDTKTGQWFYDLQVHWLGDDPDGQWAVDLSSLDSVTVEHVETLIEGGPIWRTSMPKVDVDPEEET